MNQKQEGHLYQIKKEFEKLVDAKYRKGQKEHGGNLWEILPEELLDFAIDEAIDQIVYLLTLKNKLRK